jgi:hypothetical protein
MSTFSFFQLIFDNYSKIAGTSPASAATSRSNRVLDDVSLDYSSCANLDQSELTELQQQLQTLKKQSLIVMEQSCKSSERERIALQQAQEALTLKETVAAKAAQAMSRENYMLDLMVAASLDMAGTFQIF